MRRVHLFIALYLCAQIALPLSYYTCRNDKNDERFAWRMFSATRAIKCNPTFSVDGRRYDVRRTFHVAWRRLAKRGRHAVVLAMAAKLCSDHPGKKVMVEMTCMALDRSEVSYGGDYNICDVGAL